ncbi:HEAT repeat domain-containing protein [Streptomyces sp. NPDC087440]|uniref:HEAT repeat domain-containing protein n=1 Tax=Streptomyces sp. NPDC087440 TaxID=3365790 RepID=UPI00382171AF
MDRGGTDEARRTTDELFAGALAEVSEQAGEDAEAPTPCLDALHGRPTREVFDRAAHLLGRDDPDERELGARVLRELGDPDDDGRRPFTEETVAVVLRELEDEPDPWVLSWMISVLGHHRAQQALDLVLAHRAHPEQAMRFAVAAALPDLADPDSTEQWVLEALLELATDSSDAVRWYALYALFNETVGVRAEQRRAWATRLTAEADGETERREQLAHLSTTLHDEAAADPALRDILGQRAGA